MCASVRLVVGFLLLPALLGLAACGPARPSTQPPPSPSPPDSAFSRPERVTLQGYEGDAMEPFLSRDDRWLFFNNLNEPTVDTNLHYAERLDAVTFQYRGLVRGVNTEALEGVPTMDREGNFYFVSLRSYSESLSTLYRGRFADGQLSGVELVGGISRKTLGIVNFDVEVSPDGSTLYFADGRFDGGAVPREADLVIAERQGSQFARMPGSGDIPQWVNTSALEYAASISADELELFFTRFDPERPSTGPEIYRAARSNPSEPFGAPAKVGAIEGFVEAPTLSADERALHYHKKEAGRFVLYRVTR